jgi:hypothetical protein
MLYVSAIGFCLLSLAFVFAIIVPFSLKLIYKISGKKIKLNLAIGIFIFFITFIVSIWTVAQLFLLISGDVEQVKYNVSSLLPIIDLSKIDRFKVDRFLPNFLNTIRLSIKYNISALIWNSIGVTIIFALPIFWYAINARKYRDKILETCFILLALCVYCTVPLTVIEEHEKAIKIAQAEEQVTKEQAIKDMNNQIYKQLKPTMLLRLYEGCYETYKWLEGVPSYKETDSFYECQQTEKFCLHIQSLYNVTDDSKEDLVGDKALCERFGWYGSSKRYSNDFNLN